MKQWSAPSKEGSFSDTEYLGNPSVIKDRQSPSEGSPGYYDDVNIAYPTNEVAVDLYMVPAFQGMSGQGANQSTMRPIGSV